MAHTSRWEGGGAAVLGSVQPQPLAHQDDGTLALADIEAAIKPDDAHYAKTRLLTLENTFGGKLLPFAYVQQATQLAARHGLGRHLDGARLFNAAVAQALQVTQKNSDNHAPAQYQQALPATNNISLAVPGGATFASHAPIHTIHTAALPGLADIHAQARRIAQCFDSVSVCLSKGLGHRSARCCVAAQI